MKTTKNKHISEMGFFDLIEDKRASKEAGKATVTEEPAPAGSSIPPAVYPENMAANVPKEENCSHPRPEKLKYLVPCPLCNGRDFVHGEKGGFFCVTCQPGISGHPVIAAGKHRTPTRREQQTDDGKTSSQHPAARQASRHDQAQVAFAIGFPWIMGNLQELLSRGWTRPALFRRRKFRYPAGQWGAAWSPAWVKTGVKVSIGQRRGEIIFRFTSSDDRQITQREFPPET